MNLSEHFTLEEFTQSQLASRLGLDNTPNPDIEENLKVLAQTMERVRELLGVPIHVTSGYRSPKVNAALGSSPTSKHVQGLACDFTAPTFGTPQVICKEIINSGIEFDQLIFEGTWVHLGLSENVFRNQVLTVHFGSKTTYTEGIA